VWQEVMTLEGDRGAGAWLRARQQVVVSTNYPQIENAGKDVDFPPVPR
jgi:hypothetical protein